MKNKVFIKEIFKSIQGEGLYLGVNQLFLRFAKCNLNCKYCDTDFTSNLTEYSAIDLACIVNNCKNIHSLSLTGGEPLTEIDFLIDFLPLINQKVYLETNGVLFENLKKIINFIDIVSMDIKLPSSTLGKNLFFEHEEFIKIAKIKELFIKIVFDENITDYEITKCWELGIKYQIPIILQPKMNGEKLSVDNEFISKIFNVFIDKYENIRLIPQVHKFLNIK